MFEWLCLHGLNQINGDRTVSAFYHIMTGKRSIQTIQDTRLYQLEKYYRVLPSLDRDTYDQLIKTFQAKHLIESVMNQKVVVTDKGAAVLAEEPAAFVYMLEGMDYYLVAPVFIARFELAIQTYTHLVMKTHVFDPIQQAPDVQRFIKAHYRLHHSNLDAWLTQLYQRIQQFLRPFQADYAAIFVDRLTAYQSNGQSIQQLKTRHQQRSEDVELILLGMYHQLIKQIEQAPDDLLYSFVHINQQEKVGHKLTRTAEITSRYLARGYDLAAIAAYRQLKKSTIEDHLVEICYHNPQFNTRAYVTEDEEALILAAIDQYNTYKVATLKQTLSETVSYLAIRLVLAKVYHRGKHE